VVSEEAAIYRADIAEADVRLRALEAELDRWKLRVRELEDAILMHREHLEKDATEVDDRLWEQVERLWT
jgi:predicted  nucleic acid-binding Zn-ribbon protein